MVVGGTEGARQVTLLANPNAGTGRGMRVADLIERRLRDAGLDVRRIQESSAEVARARLRDLVGPTRTPGRTAPHRGGPGGSVVVCGGDGTVHLAIQTLAGSTTAMGIVPAGTGNDLARALGFPTDPDRAAEVVLAGRTRRIDLGRVTSDDDPAKAVHMATAVATGLDADIAARAARSCARHGRRPAYDIAARLPGALRYPLATVAELPRMRPRDYRLVLDGEERACQALLVAVANGPSYGGGLRIAPDARLDDGRLDVVVVAPVSRRRLAWEFRRLRDGSILEIPQVTRHRVREVRIETKGVPHADGESLRLGPNVKVEAVPAALEVIA